MTEVNGIEVSYEVSGSGEPLLLVMGLGGQLTDWHGEFVSLLERRFTVIRFDNRDAGLSTISTAPAPTRWQLIKSSLWPRTAQPAYQLDDMADDAVGVLDAVGVDAAHVVGMSMGGMIAQLLTLRHPGRVKSLCSIMSTTGDRRNGRPELRVLASLARRGQPNRDQVVDVTMELFQMVGGADWDPIEQRLRTTASVERSYNPGGVLRQSVAIAAAPDRTDRLTTVTHPTLVIHGLDDRLVQPSGGSATARAIPGSRLLMFPDMGHDLPATRHIEMVDAIVTNASRGEER